MRDLASKRSDRLYNFLIISSCTKMTIYMYIIKKQQFKQSILFQDASLQCGYKMGFLF